MRVWPARDYTRVTIEHDSELKFTQFAVSNPPRLGLDIEGIQLNDALKGLIAKILPNDPYIQSVRIGQNRPKVVRLVFDLKEEVRPQIFQLLPVAQYKHRLVLDLYPSAPADPLLALLDKKTEDPIALRRAEALSPTQRADAARSAPSSASAQASSHVALKQDQQLSRSAERAAELLADKANDKANDKGSERGSDKVADKSAERTQVARAQTGAPAAGPSEHGRELSAARNASGPQAAQQSATGDAPFEHRHFNADDDAPTTRRPPGKRRSDGKHDEPVVSRLVTIALDPGHGGEDPGAIGPRGTQEKVVVLSIAKRLKAMIDAEPNMRAMLTRDADFFVPLAQRVEKARQVQADLFVSLHADAFTNQAARGSSVFVLSDGAATSTTARWLAKRENDADLIGGVNLGSRDSSLAKTLLDMSTTAQIKDSLKLGSAVLNEIGSINRLHKPQVEKAGFAVLKAPDIPSILVETAFISNPEEEAKLRDSDHQDQIARAIMVGIRRYFAKNPPLAKSKMAML